MANDPALAEAVATGRVQIDEPAAGGGPRLSDWTPEMAMLAVIVDKLSALQHAVLAAGGAKHLPKLKPTERPQSALAAAMAMKRNREALAEAAAIADLFLPPDARTRTTPATAG